MARKQLQTPQEIHYCKECRHAYDYHEKDVYGEYFMCRCPYFGTSRFLRHDTCNKFKQI